MNKEPDSPLAFAGSTVASTHELVERAAEELLKQRETLQPILTEYGQKIAALLESVRAKKLEVAEAMTLLGNLEAMLGGEQSRIHLLLGRSQSIPGNLDVLPATYGSLPKSGARKHIELSLAGSGRRDVATLAASEVTMATLENVGLRSAMKIWTDQEIGSWSRPELAIFASLIQSGKPATTQQLAEMTSYAESTMYGKTRPLGENLCLTDWSIEMDGARTVTAKQIPEDMHTIQDESVRTLVNEAITKKWKELGYHTNLVPSDVCYPALLRCLEYLFAEAGNGKTSFQEEEFDSLYAKTGNALRQVNYIVEDKYKWNGSSLTRKRVEEK